MKNHILGIGLTLHPSHAYLDLCRDLIDNEADFFETSPETTWHVDPSGKLLSTPWSFEFQTIQNRLQKPFVAHGLGLSPGTAGESPKDQMRLQQWLRKIEEDQHQFQYQWYTEHLGWIEQDGKNAILPLPLPPTQESVDTVAGRLSLLKPVIPDVGFENQVSYFSFGDILEEPPFWNKIGAQGNLWLLLDLHNVYTQCLNFKVSMDDYLQRIDLSRVIEIHLSGGSESNPQWLPSGEVLRLDSHDGPVPDEVWRAYEAVLPKCHQLRGVVVERLDEAVSEEEVPLLREEMRKARRILECKLR